jgi:hypothetical protein
MSRYTLKDDGLPYKKIMQGRKWVGRVWKDAEGMFVGKIGRTEHRDVSVLTAFEGAVAEHLGYADVVALKMHNAEVRAANKLHKQQAQYAAQEMLRGNYGPFEKLFLK